VADSFASEVAAAEAAAISGEATTHVAAAEATAHVTAAEAAAHVTAAEPTAHGATAAAAAATAVSATAATAAAATRLCIGHQQTAGDHCGSQNHQHSFEHRTLLLMRR
jgi:hypothetical protein